MDRSIYGSLSLRWSYLTLWNILWLFWTSSKINLFNLYTLYHFIQYQNCFKTLLCLHQRFFIALGLFYDRIKKIKIP